MKINPSNFRVLIASLAVCAWSAQAATVINPVDISLTGADEFFPALNLINGSGLEFQLNTGDPLPATWNHMVGSPDANSWVSGAFGFPSDWFAASGTIPTFVLDLGQETLVDTVHLWAYSGGSAAGMYQGNSARIFEFRFNTEAQGNVDFTGPAVGADADHGLITDTPPGFTLPRQDFNVGTHDARYVQMRITDNWFVAPGDGTTTDEHGHPMRGGDRVGLGEVRFSVVPEPSTYTVLGMGLALLFARGLIRKRG
jgi:hypothetical protein